MENTVPKFDAVQIEQIISKIVPLIAEPKDYEFFRGVLFLKAESCKTSAEFALFIKKLIER